MATKQIIHIVVEDSEAKLQDGFDTIIKEAVDNIQQRSLLAVRWWRESGTMTTTLTRRTTGPSCDRSAGLDAHGSVPRTQPDPPALLEYTHEDMNNTVFKNK